MGTWVKETDKALYLMQGNYYLAMVPKRPSSSNPRSRWPMWGCSKPGLPAAIALAA